jgi:hypothetical protein
VVEGRRRILRQGLEAKEEGSGGTETEVMQATHHYVRSESSTAQH